MATRTLEIVYKKSGDVGAEQVSASLGKVEAAASKASSSVTSFSGGVKGLASDLGLPVSPAALATAGIAALGAAVVTSVNAAREGRAVQAQLAAVLESTGHAAGISQAELNKHAEALQNVTNYDDEAIGSGQALLLTFDKIGKDIFPQATKTAMDMATAFKMDLGQANIMLGKTLNDPISQLGALRRNGISFTEAEEKMIKSMARAGDMAGAQAKVLEVVNKQVAGSAEAARVADGGFIALSNSVGNLTEAAGDLILGINDGTGAVSGLIGMVDSLTETVTEAGEAIRSGPVGALEALGAVANPLTPIMAALGMDIFPSVTAASENLTEATTDQAGAAQMSAEAVAVQEEALAKLAITEAEYYIEAQKLREDFEKAEQEYLGDKLDTQTKMTEDTIKNNQDATQKIRDLETKANQDKLKTQQDFDNKRQSMIMGADQQQAGVLQARLSSEEQQRQQRIVQIETELKAEKEKVLTHQTEINETVHSKGEERLAELERQAEEEKRIYAEKMQDLLLLTALKVAENDGKLLELTGGLTDKADETFALIEAGIISFSGGLKQNVDTTLGDISAKSGDFARNQEKNNQSIIASTEDLIGVNTELKGSSTSTYSDGASASKRATDSIVSDFDRQARAAKATYDSRQTSTYSSTKRNTDWGPGYATGGAFKVPPGYPNDTFPMRVSSGEMVSVIPAGEAGRGPGFTKGTGRPSGVPSNYKYVEFGPGAAGWVPPNYIWTGSTWSAPGDMAMQDRVGGYGGGRGSPVVRGSSDDYVSRADFEASSFGGGGASSTVVTSRFTGKSSTRPAGGLSRDAARSQRAAAGVDWAALDKSQKEMAARAQPAPMPTVTPSGSSSGGSTGSKASTEGGIHFHIDYHPAVSLSDQRQLVDVLKQAVREINRLDKVVTA